jgi:hypothetical protein
MMQKNIEPKFSPGFRISIMDLGILVGGAIAAISISRFDVWLGIAAAFVVAHFFLFCNVLRLSRPPELIWAGLFIALAVAASNRFIVSWPVAFFLSVVLTLVLALAEFRRPSYHGVGWRTINSGLVDWWSCHRQQKN